MARRGAACLEVESRGQWGSAMGMGGWEVVLGRGREALLGLQEGVPEEGCDVTPGFLKAVLPIGWDKTRSIAPAPPFW